MINAGAYNKRISIYERVEEEDSGGFWTVSKGPLVLSAWAKVKTTKGFTLIVNDTDFEKAYTNFTIRYPHSVKVTRDMLLEFNDKLYTIEYLNNVDEANVELEIQAKLVSK